MECCDKCENITHDKYGEETADCSDNNCVCHSKVIAGVDFTESLKTLKEL